ncbi:hypothetical protein CYMTET_40798 [Cymbomonas tetramitiformis]|uniref:Uncharacterized protein n=1 Tax=Cymbomonas tetramitiformis TaxID=36881 RepID=A0AAE0C7B0_9CHLO|nr:hypothetical protein CYMTET_40798 [Cymbomonas tetramitiformis]
MNAKRHKLLDLAKAGEWDSMLQMLRANKKLDLNVIPEPRSFGVLHQIAYHGPIEVLHDLFRIPHVTVDMTLRTKGSEEKTALEVAEESGRSEGVLNEFQTLTLAEAAKRQDWVLLEELMQTADAANVNVVHPLKHWGVIHHIAYHGTSEVLNDCFTRNGIIPDLNLKTRVTDSQASAGQIGETAADIARRENEGIVQELEGAAGPSAGPSGTSGTPATAPAATAAAAGPSGSSVTPTATAATAAATADDVDVCVVCMVAPKDAAIIHGATSHQVPLTPWHFRFYPSSEHLPA